jgi:hypothetical protein
MRRRLFDVLVSAGGALIVVVLLVAGGLAMWGYHYATTNVHDQLAQQEITFPAKDSPALASPEIGPYLNKYAGQQLLTGPQAKAYADHFIAVHLSAMPLGGVYSKVSAASQAAPSDTKLAAEDLRPARTLVRDRGIHPRGPHGRSRRVWILAFPADACGRGTVGQAKS